MPEVLLCDECEHMWIGGRSHAERMHLARRAGWEIIKTAAGRVRCECPVCRLMRFVGPPLPPDRRPYRDERVWSMVDARLGRDGARIRYGQAG